MLYRTGKALSVSYLIQIKSSASKELKRIDKQQRLRIINAIDDLSNTPYKGKSLKGELTGLRRIRVGSYRVIYEVYEQQIVILILRIAHRKDIYR